MASVSCAARRAGPTGGPAAVVLPDGGPLRVVGVRDRRRLRTRGIPVALSAMARADLRHPANAAGEWFVDTRCIDCGTCRELAPTVFVARGGTSVVARQPDVALEAELAAQACPTQSIGTVSRRLRPGRLYPKEIADGTGVFDCGYAAESSFGATSWFVVRPEGNLLVDSPRWNAGLECSFDAAGGIDHVLLTHCDDVADAERWATRFGTRVWIGEDDRWAAPFATDVIDGEVTVQPGLVAVPVPGHTKGSVVFLLDDTYLFTGDSLAWSHDAGDLTAFRGACWYSWRAQTESLGRLVDRRFEWVLPGHGARARLDDGPARLAALVGRMARTP